MEKKWIQTNIDVFTDFVNQFDNVTTKSMNIKSVNIKTMYQNNKQVARVINNNKFWVFVNHSEFKNIIRKTYKVTK